MVFLVIVKCAFIAELTQQCHSCCFAFALSFLLVVAAAGVGAGCDGGISCTAGWASAIGLAVSNKLLSSLTLSTILFKFVESKFFFKCVRSNSVALSMK